MRKKNLVKLKPKERKYLKELIAKGEKGEFISFASKGIRRVKDWLNALPSGTISTWDELKMIFLSRFFPTMKY